MVRALMRSILLVQGIPEARKASGIFNPKATYQGVAEFRSVSAS